MEKLFDYKNENGVISVITPYDAEFVNKARNLRGKWKDGAWHFDDSIEDYVKQALKDCYGTTGEDPVDTCSLVIKNFDDSTDCGPVTLFGRTIAKAWGRDSGAKLGDNIIWISGKYFSGGSVKNWRTGVVNAYFEIQNFPVPRTKFEDVQKAIEGGWCEIKMPKRKRTPEQIQADIEKYEAILAELRNELNNL